jgi:mono/diheme cytochrome c family protein
MRLKCVKVHTKRVGARGDLRNHSPYLARSSGKDSQVMKSLVLVCVLSISVLGQSAGPEAVQVKPVAGESWLNHLHRTFQETSMGKTGRLGPPTSLGGEQTPDWQRELSASTRQTVTLRGSDLYRLNCWGCHGEFGLGAPPEINSVINPTRAASAQLVMERMKNLGMDMSRKDAAVLADQSKVALLQRLHNGGTDMPPFPHLNDSEVRAIFAYLKQLAEVPGAERQQAAVEESRLRVGEHIVKSTCHICHDAAGQNPNPEQLFNGAIPPLNTLTTRTSLPEFERKIRSGAPIVMGTPPSPFRGRMPVFYYLSEDEVADAYLYLKLNPPASTVPDPAMPAIEQKQAANKILPVGFTVEPTTVSRPSNARDLIMIVFPLASEIFVALLLVGGFWYTLREIRRLTAISRSRKVLVMGDGSVAEHAPRPASGKSHPEMHPLTNSTTNDKAAIGVPGHVDEQPFHHDDYRRFEISWLARWLEGEDEAA